MEALKDWSQWCMYVLPSVGPRDAFRGLTFDWELTEKRGLDLEAAETAGAKGQGRNKLGTSVAGPPRLSGRKMVEVSMGRQAQTGSLRALWEVELYLTEMENNWSLLSFHFFFTLLSLVHVTFIFKWPHIRPNVGLISQQHKLYRSLSFLTMT